MSHEDHWNGERIVWRAYPVPAEQRSVAQRILADMEHRLKPAERDWISGRIATLLAHYFAPEMPPELQTAVAGDWVSILGELPRDAIETACAQYLKADSRARPTPGQIYQLARAHIRDDVQDRDRLAQCLGEKSPQERGGVRSLGSVTKEQALESAAKAKTHLRAEIAKEEAETKARRKGAGHG